MNKIDLYELQDSIGQVDEELLTGVDDKRTQYYASKQEKEAAVPPKNVKSPRRKLLHWISLAACLCVAVGIAALGPQIMNKSTSNDSASLFQSGAESSKNHSYIQNEAVKEDDFDIGHDTKIETEGIPSEMPEYSMVSEGRILFDAHGGCIFINEQNSPISMADGSTSGNLFEGLTDGDLVRLYHSWIRETYPGQATGYALEKLEDGSMEDISADVIQSLTELGWLSSSDNP